MDFSVNNNNQVTFGSPFGGADPSPAIGGGDSLADLIKKYKDNPGLLMVMLLYVYIPHKEEDMGNYIAGIGKQLKDQGDLLNLWNQLQADLNQIGEYAQELPDSGKPLDGAQLKILAELQKEVQKFKTQLGEFESKFQAYADKIKKKDPKEYKQLENFFKTINQAWTALGTVPNGTYSWQNVSIGGACGTFISWFKSSDQTQLKTYMNNFSTGTTAFTSISSYSQQQEKIYSQQYDSGQGLIKSGLGTLTQQEQTMVNNERSS